VREGLVVADADLRERVARGVSALADAEDRGHRRPRAEPRDVERVPRVPPPARDRVRPDGAVQAPARAPVLARLERGVERVLDRRRRRVVDAAAAAGNVIGEDPPAELVRHRVARRNHELLVL